MTVFPRYLRFLSLRIFKTSNTKTANSEGSLYTFLLTSTLLLVNFINVLRANFTFKSLFGSFERKMLMKLTVGVNCINIFSARFLYVSAFY